MADDRIIPFARIEDGCVLLLESAYPAGGDLTTSGTTVGRALAADRYLSDDPMAVLDSVLPDALGDDIFIPDLAIGRLVESPENSLDLPQTMLAAGVQAYIANTGYGWGLNHGIGYGERLAEIFTEELTSGGTKSVGDLVRRTKTRYLLETPRLDAYDAKSLMQWSHYGLPMCAVRTGIAVGGKSLFEGPSPEPYQVKPEISLGPVRLEQRLSQLGKRSLPAYLTRMEMYWDFTAPGIYTKRSSLGEIYAEPWDEGCDDPDGCYYTLNTLVERLAGREPLLVTQTLTEGIAGKQLHSHLPIRSFENSRRNISDRRARVFQQRSYDSNEVPRHETVVNYKS